MSATSLRDLLTQAERADEGATRRHAALAEAYREAEQERGRAVLAAWQAIADRYDPAGLRKAVVDSYARLTAAVTGDGAVGPALTGYATAVLREGAQARLAVDAATSGATVAGDPSQAVGYRTHTGEGIITELQRDGRIVNGLTEHIGSDLVAQTALAAAQSTVASEISTAMATVTAAYESVEIKAPPLYAMRSAARTDSFVDRIGATTLQFVGDPAGSVCYLEAGVHDHVINFYRNHQAGDSPYSFIPVWGVPKRHAGAVGAAPDATGGGTGVPVEPGH